MLGLLKKCWIKVVKDYANGDTKPTHCAAIFIDWLG